ncbi:UbiD family decarboxylase [Saccharopolyspora sp. 5N708]|uniref:UbiD family decarboxylase n=1 Tax=Saccharopolyspora sp. 5N708 TaxID=3457424 RepID=UPI003FD19242
MAYNEYDQPHADLRELITRIDKAGELVRVPGVELDLELGTLIELIAHRAGEGGPAVLFDDVVGAAKGRRVFSGATNSARRLALTMGLPTPEHPMDVVRSYRDRMKRHRPIPPVYVDTGPILDNVLRDEEVDVTAFQAPLLHELDGGRYIGTDDLVIMADPDEHWINAGTYRVQVHGPDRVGLWTSPGKQGRQIRDKYFSQGKPCPVLISCGHDPLLFLAAGNELRYGLSEFDYAGGHRGQPFEVVRSELHGLPMPAHAELVLEGEIHPGDTAPEGPFGEFTGYYAGGRSDQPVVRIRRIYHRTDPILTVASPIRPPSNFSYSKCVMKSGMIWDEVERAGLSGVQGVWCHEAGAARLFNVISIKQAYAGHAKQAALLAAGCQSGSYLGRFVVVVDEDIDPTNMFDVLWAMSTRCDPAEDIEIVRGAWSGPLDPRIPRGVTRNSRALISAVRPFERLAEFPPVAEASPQLRAKVAEKFSAVLDRLGHEPFEGERKA